MSRRTPNAVTTVDLPSGRTLEVVYPQAGDPYTRVRPVEPTEDRDLAVCERCSRDLVEPTVWEPAGAACWRIVLYCPNCDHTSEGVFSEERADDLDSYLDDAAALMVSDLKRLEHANMIDDVERFIGALAADAILPEDFNHTA